MKAIEARKLADEKHLDSQLLEIEDIIAKAAKDGKYEVWYYNYVIEDSVRQKITENGFLVGKTQSDRGETLTNITW